MLAVHSISGQVHFVQSHHPENIMNMGNEHLVCLQKPALPRTECSTNLPQAAHLIAGLLVVDVQYCLHLMAVAPLAQATAAQKGALRGSWGGASVAAGGVNRCFHLAIDMQPAQWHQAVHY